MIALNAISRLASVPVLAQDIHQALPCQGEGGSTFFQTSAGMVSRIALTGLLISWDGTTGMIDDGTGQVLLRRGENPHEMTIPPIGSILFCIGRIRQLGSDRYVSVESLATLANPGWLTYRRLEVSLFRQQFTAPTPPPENAVPSAAAGATPDSARPAQKQRVIEAIKLLDAGDGADIALVLARSEETDDTRIRELIKFGDVYEHKPGKLKLLE